MNSSVSQEEAQLKDAEGSRVVDAPPLHSRTRKKGAFSQAHPGWGLSVTVQLLASCLTGEPSCSGAPATLVRVNQQASDMSDSLGLQERLGSSCWARKGCLFLEFIY